MADDSTDIAQRGLDELFKGTDVLGAPTELRLAGTGALPGGGAAAALPAPAGPGGVAGGFLGGSQGQRAAGGGGGGGPDALGTAQSALDAAIKSGKFGQSLFGGDLGTRGDIGGAGTPQDSSTSLSDRLRTGFSPAAAGAPSTLTAQDLIQQLQGLNLGESLNPEQLEAIGQFSGLPGGGAGGAGAVEGAGSVAGGLGTAAGGAGAAGAILGLIAALTGNQDLGTAAQGVGGAATALGTGSTLAGAGTGIAGTGATTAAGAVAAPAAVLAAPIIGTMLLDSLFSKKGEDIVSSTIQDYQGAYPTFPQELMRSEAQQKQGLDVLTKALPYVQSKEELGQLLNSMKNYVGTTTGIPMDMTNPYQLTTIPGTGPVTHGQQTPSIDWGPQTQQLQGQIDQLMGVLPGTAITAPYGQPGGGLEGDAAMRLWSQFMPREQVAPLYNPTEIDPSVLQTGSEGSLNIPGLPKGFYTAGELATAGQTGVPYGSPGYDYAGSGFPAPGQYVGQVSPYWQQLQGAARAPQAATAANALNAVGAGDMGTSGFEGLLSDEQKRALGLQ